MPSGVYKRTEEHKINIGKSVSKWRQAYKKLISGESAPMYGKTHTEESKQKNRKAHLGKPSPRKGIILTQKTKQKISDSRKGKASNFKNPELRNRKISKANSKSIKRLWQNSEYRDKQVKAIAKGSVVKPNKAEQKLNRLLQRLLPNEYKYVGNGEFILAGKCPDFINVNGKKQIIELYGNYWHRNDNPQDRINLFSQYGYETLIVWEDELENLNNLSQKLLKFAE